jgi:hypothetical protein
MPTDEGMPVVIAFGVVAGLSVVLTLAYMWHGWTRRRRVPPPHG